MLRPPTRTIWHASRIIDITEQQTDHLHRYKIISLPKNIEHTLYIFTSQPLHSKRVEGSGPLKNDRRGWSGMKGSLEEGVEGSGPLKNDGRVTSGMKSSLEVGLTASFDFSRPYES
jgi:hypothetical protein